MCLQCCDYTSSLSSLFAILAFSNVTYHGCCHYSCLNVFLFILVAFRIPGVSAMLQLHVIIIIITIPLIYYFCFLYKGQSLYIIIAFIIVVVFLFILVAIRIPAAFAMLQLHIIIVISIIMPVIIIIVITMMIMIIIITNVTTITPIHLSRYSLTGFLEKTMVQLHVQPRLSYVICNLQFVRRRLSNYTCIIIIIIITIIITIKYISGRRLR